MQQHDAELHKKYIDNLEYAAYVSTKIQTNGII